MPLHGGYRSQATRSGGGPAATAAAREDRAYHPYQRPTEASSRQISGAFSLSVVPAVANFSLLVASRPTPTLNHRAPPSGLHADIPPAYGIPAASSLATNTSNLQNATMVPQPQLYAGQDFAAPQQSGPLSTSNMANPASRLPHTSADASELQQISHSGRSQSASGQDVCGPQLYCPPRPKFIPDTDEGWCARWRLQFPQMEAFLRSKSILQQDQTLQGYAVNKQDWYRHMLAMHVLQRSTSLTSEFSVICSSYGQFVRQTSHRILPKHLARGSKVRNSILYTVI